MIIWEAKVGRSRRSGYAASHRAQITRPGFGCSVRADKERVAKSSPIGRGYFHHQLESPRRHRSRHGHRKDCVVLIWNIDRSRRRDHIRLPIATWKWGTVIGI